MFVVPLVEVAAVQVVVSWCVTLHEHHIISEVHGCVARNTKPAAESCNFLIVR